MQQPTFSRLSKMADFAFKQIKRGSITVAGLRIQDVPASFPETSASHAMYLGPGQKVKFESGLAMPTLLTPTDAVVRVLKTTICGTDLHILNGNVHSCKPGRRIGHEGIGEIVDVGSAVTDRKVGDRVLVNTTTSCGKCLNCSNKFYSHCEDGGWMLGNQIDGMQGTYARIPHIDSSSKMIPRNIWNTEMEDDIVLCSDILPTALEVGIIDGEMKEGQQIAIVGAGPVGLAALLTSAMLKPKSVFIVDVNEHRLQASLDCASSPDLKDTEVHVINNSDSTAVGQIMEMTNGQGVDLAVEAIGLPIGWYTCQDIVKAGGNIAILGVHGKAATINLERMWHRNFKLRAGLVHGYSIDMLMERIMSDRLPARKLISHRMPLSEIETAYHMFSNAGAYKSLKILLENDL